MKIYCYTYIYHTQENTTGFAISIDVKSRVTYVVAALGSLMTLLEVSSYLIFFHYISKHNKTIAANVLKPSVIKQRNRANAVSMYGQLACWVMKIWYAVLIVILVWCGLILQMFWGMRINFDYSMWIYWSGNCNWIIINSNTYSLKNSVLHS